MKNEKLDDGFVDAAAGEALSSLSGGESAGYARTLAQGSADEKRFDREMRETVARMAGAAPYMKPREELRGRILQATAPASFKMEDYRRANRDAGRFYKWGFYAAMAFLAAGAWYNVTLQNKMSAVQTAAVKTFGEMNDVIKQRDSALTAMVNPHVQQISIKNDQGQVTGKAYVNPAAKTALVVLAEGMLPPNEAPQMVVKDKSGKTMQIPTQFVQVARSAFPDVVQTGMPAQGTFAIKDVQPDPETKVFRAGMGQ